MCIIQTFQGMNQKSCIRSVIAMAILFAITQASLGQTTTAPSTAPTTQEASRQEKTDERLKFLTTQLASIDSAIGVTTSKIAFATRQLNESKDRVKSYQENNEQLDRRENKRVDPRRTDGKSRANDDARKREINSVREKEEELAALRAKRKQLQTDQTALWAKIAYRMIEKEQLDNSPIYQLEITSKKSGEVESQRLAVARASAAMMRSSLQFVENGSKQIDENVAAGIKAIPVAMHSAKKDFSAATKAGSLLSSELGSAGSPLNATDLAFQQLEDTATSINEAFKSAEKSDSSNDEQRIASDRRLLQESFKRFSVDMLAADRAVKRMCEEWSFTAGTQKAIVKEPVTPKGGEDLAVRTGLLGQWISDQAIKVGPEFKPIPTDIMNQSSATLMAWIRPSDSAPGSRFIAWRVIEADKPGEYGSGWGLDNGRIKVILDDLFWNTGIQIAVGEWHHVALVFDSKKAEVYVDGAVVAQREYKQGGVSKEQYAIGRLSHYRGDIFDVRIYKRMLTAAEISEILSRGRPAK